MKWRFAQALAVCMILVCSMPCSADPVLPLASSGGQWVLQPDYSDEFNDASLDTHKWNNAIGSWKDWSWAPANTAVKGGVLHLRMSYAPHTRDGKKMYYKSGIIKPRAPAILYGYFEARVKGAPVFPGVCPAVWLYHKEDKLWTEIDIVELTQKPDLHIIDTTGHIFIHPQLPPMTEDHHLVEQHKWLAPWDPRDDFHIYGTEWDAENITWYIDGKPVYHLKNKYWHQPLDLTLSLGLRRPLKKHPSSGGFPTEMQVDYVRVWQKAPTQKTAR